MTNLFEPVPVIKQFPWIAQMMAALPMSALKSINPDMAMFQGAKDVSLNPDFGSRPWQTANNLDLPERPQTGRAYSSRVRRRVYR